MKYYDVMRARLFCKNQIKTKTTFFALKVLIEMTQKKIII